jgi:dTDP-4-dehydrorhamnose 3,5-epimerase
MGALRIHGLLLHELKIIPGALGSVLHALKVTDEGFVDFGEVYFSTVNRNAVKGWKKHQRMTLNLVVPVGEIQFVIFDDRPESKTKGVIDQLTLSRKNYGRLTVPPGVWVAFKGLGDPDSMLMNLASIPHDPTEAINIPINSEIIPFHDWK